MLLDPRFKDRFLSGTIQQAEAKRMLIEELEKIEDYDDAGSLEPPSKRSNADITELWQSFNEILEESGSSAESENTVIGSVVEQYLAEPLLEFHSSNCFTLWKVDFHY